MREEQACPRYRSLMTDTPVEEPADGDAAEEAEAPEEGEAPAEAETAEDDATDE